MSVPLRLPDAPSYSRARRALLESVIERTRGGLPPPPPPPPSPDLADIVRDELRIDLSTHYAGIPIRHPFGKASGQLSCTAAQVEEDLRAGLAFIVLKTVIAEAPSGERSMEAWTVRDTKMVVERRSSLSGRDGWTVTWTGRGWHGTLIQYLEFFATSLDLAGETGPPVVPSVKYHLAPGGEPFRTEEYRHTTAQLLAVWERKGRVDPMPLEKDFSPTLAGDTRSADRDVVLRWLEHVPALIDAAAPGRVRVGVKVMNAVADDDFQVAMLEVLSRPAQSKPGFLVVFNRLFDETSGVAYGGWDLSDRNLRVLDLARRKHLAGPPPPAPSPLSLPPLSATGNICSGRVMLEYALRGCENGQVHTFFQLPRDSYLATGGAGEGGGSRSSRALHTLLLHPVDGLVAWLWHLNEAARLEEVDGLVRFRDAIGAADG